MEMLRRAPDQTPLHFNESPAAIYPKYTAGVAFTDGKRNFGMQPDKHIANV